MDKKESVDADDFNIIISMKTVKYIHKNDMYIQFIKQ